MTLPTGPNQRLPSPKDWMSVPCGVSTFLIAAGALWFAKGAVSSERLALRSKDPAEVSRWIEKESGIKVALAPSPEVQIAGEHGLNSPPRDDVYQLRLKVIFTENSLISRGP